MNVVYESSHYIVATAQRWFEKDVITAKHAVTKMEVAQLDAKLKRNGSGLPHTDTRDEPPHQLLHLYVARYQLTRQDYYPIDVESVRWLNGQSSTLQFLSLEQVDEGPFRRVRRPSIVPFNETIPLLGALRQSILHGRSVFGDRELKEVPLFIQMEWMRNFKTPPEIMHQWLRITQFLHDIQSIIPDANEADPEWIDQWFSVVQAFWKTLLKEVRNHMFFRKFRSIDDIPRFQHSVRWAMFFYMFQTTEDPREVVALKELIITNAVFQKGIRDFIETVEIALDQIKPIVLSALDVSCEDDVQIDVEMTLILDVMNIDNDYQRWWMTLLIDSCDHWRSTLLDALAGDLIDNPMKEVLAAEILWDLEALVAYIEPVLFRKKRLYRVLMSLRNRIRRHIFQIILKESWF